MATCTKCDKPLLDNSLKLDDASVMGIFKCSNGHRKIKYLCVITRAWLTDNRVAH